jgi:hypothetical protein
MKLGQVVATNSDVVRHFDTDFLNRYVAPGNMTKELGKKDGGGW